jgi:hypothetical protein
MPIVLHYAMGRGPRFKTRDDPREARGCRADESSRAVLSAAGGSVREPSFRISHRLIAGCHRMLKTEL